MRWPASTGRPRQRSASPDPATRSPSDITEALNAGRFFRLVDGKNRELAIGRLYDPSGQNELAPLDDFGRQNLGALNIQFRAEGDWQAA